MKPIDDGYAVSAAAFTADPQHAAKTSAETAILGDIA
jgi:hypothetical protein